MGSKTKRTIPGKSGKIISILRSLAIILICVSFAASAGRIVYLFLQHSPRVIKERIATATNRDVTIGGVSIAFPNIISIHDLVIKEKKEDSVLFRAVRLDCKLGPQLLKGQTHVYEINVYDSFVKIDRQDKTFNISHDKLRSVLRELSHQPGMRTITLDPFQWPAAIQLKKISFQNCKLNFNDKLKRLPSLESYLDLDLTLPEQTGSYPLGGSLHVKECTFAYNNLNGTVKGNIDLTKNLASPSLVITLSDGNEIMLHGAVRDYLDTPACKISLTANQFTFKDLADVRFPFLPLDSNLSIVGEINLTELSIYNSQMPALTGKFSFAQGKWEFDPLNLQLPESQNEISGTLLLNGAEYMKSSEADKKNAAYGKMSFTYKGLPLNHSLISTLYGSIDYKSPPHITTLTGNAYIQINDGRLSISDVSLNNTNGALILEGQMNPQTSELDMSGKFIVSNHLSSISEKIKSTYALNDKVVLPVTMQGTVGNPHITVAGKKVETVSVGATKNKVKTIFATKTKKKKH